MYIATLENHVEIVQVLLEQNADVDAKQEGLSALHAAAQEGYLEIVQALFAKGAAVDVSNEQWIYSTASSCSGRTS